MQSYGLARIPLSTEATREPGTQLIKRSRSNGSGDVGVVALRCIQNIQVSHGGRSLTSKNPLVSACDSPLVIDILNSQTKTRPSRSSTFGCPASNSRRVVASTLTASSSSAKV